MVQHHTVVNTQALSISLMTTTQVTKWSKHQLKQQMYLLRNKQLKAINPTLRIQYKMFPVGQLLFLP